MAYIYACSNFPGMDGCPGRFTSEAESELGRHIELHAMLAHGEDPNAWADEDRATLHALISSD